MTAFGKDSLVPRPSTPHGVEGLGTRLGKGSVNIVLTIYIKMQCVW